MGHRWRQNVGESRRMKSRLGLAGRSSLKLGQHLSPSDVRVTSTDGAASIPRIWCPSGTSLFAGRSDVYQPSRASGEPHKAWGLVNHITGKGRPKTVVNCLKASS